MCRGVAKVHAQCGHHRSKEIRQQCASGYDPNFGCRNNRLWVEQIVIHAPPLCKNCYCAREANICDVYNQRIDNAQANAARTRDQVQAAEQDYQQTLQKYQRREVQWSVVQQKIVELTDAEALLKRWERVADGLAENKVMELKDFRDQMGVWGDG